jgi:hypothetical protein
MADGVVAQPLPGSTLTNHGLVSSSATTNDCEQAGERAELEYGLPAGLLLAIGRIESGRKDPQTGRYVPWPWAINAEGRGALFSTRSEALKQIQALQDRGTKSIDVGCFQINLFYHPKAFMQNEDALDARSNANYAGQFLTSLYARTGSWRDAVAAYHSAHPERSGAYSAKVFASWGSESRLKGTFGQQSRTADSAIAFSTFSPRVRVWTPGGAGTTPGLPHVIGPRGSVTNLRSHD